MVKLLASTNICIEMFICKTKKPADVCQPTWLIPMLNLKNKYNIYPYRYWVANMTILGWIKWLRKYKGLLFLILYPILLCRLLIVYIERDIQSTWGVIKWVQHQEEQPLVLPWAFYPVWYRHIYHLWGREFRWLPTSQVDIIPYTQYHTDSAHMADTNNRENDFPIQQQAWQDEQ